MIKAGVFIAGCVYSRDVFGFAHRVKIPILMVNGRYDNYFPYDLTQVPLYNAFATPDEHKHLESYPTDHNISSHRTEMIRINLEWLDKYLGPVQRD
jgi:cephalosporin-C deacetylase-like acetyl esterase